MRTSLLDTATMLVVVGGLLIATADSPASFLAVVGYLCVALSLVSAVTGFRSRRDTGRPLPLDPAERDKLRVTREQDGLVTAVRQLRSAHPQLGRVEAKQLVDGL